jgi:hypothetical protein
MRYLIILNHANTYIDCYKEITPDDFYEIQCTLELEHYTIDAIIQKLEDDNNYFDDSTDLPNITPTFSDYNTFIIDELNPAKLKLLLL